MHNLSLDRNAPNAFVLVPDGEFQKDPPIEDQVWTLILDSTDPHPFFLSTTYGLRAKSMRVFPNFIIGNRRISKPEDFSRLPRVTCYSPSSVQVEAEYQKNISFLFKFFFLEPEVLTGSIQVKHSKEIAAKIILQLAVNLVPMGKGQPSHPDKSGINQFLTGKTDQIEPVLFMTGGPTAINNPFPALSIELEVEPGEMQEISWALASKKMKSDSLEKAKQTINSGWREALNQHLIHHSGQRLEIKTGKPDWDAAFLLSQVNANTHLLKCKQNPDDAIFIKTRLPDQSSIGNDSDILANDLTNLELNHLCQLILPEKIDLARQLLDKQITKLVERLQKKPQEVDFKMGSLWKCCPMLTSILLEIFEITQDKEVLEHHFLSVDILFKSWVLDLSSGSEKEFLHWDNPSQLQVDTGLFTFDRWETYGKGLDIRKAESPALYALLFKEAKSIHKISKILGERSQQRFYAKMQKKILQKMENCWRDDKRIYGYKDIETHQCPPKVRFYEGHISEKTEIEQTLTKQQRLHCTIYSSDERTRACTLNILGKSSDGKPIREIFRSPDILWANGRAHLTTEHLYTEIDTISFVGLEPRDKLIVETADYSQTDITCFLPLWANAGSELHLKETTKMLMESPKIETPFGIPETWESQHPLPEDLPIRVNLLWNTLILEGFVNQGESKQAANLFTNLMSAIIQGLKDYDGFYPLFDHQTGHPAGQYNAITALIPIRLFLKIAGIKLLSPTRVALWDINPFPFPIEIHWKGLSLWKEKEQTKIVFPNGATAEHNTQNPVLITSG